MATLDKRGVRQAILTNADARRASWIEEHADAFPGIEAVFASARIGHAKPAPEAFAHAARALGLDAGAILFVDDEAANVNAAASAGMRSFRYSVLARDALRRLVTTAR